MTNKALVEALRTIQVNFCRMNCPHGAEQNWPHDPACETLRQSVSALASSGNEAPGDDKGLVERMARIIDPDAWHEALHAEGCGLYWITRRHKAMSKAEAITALSSGNEVAKVVGWLEQQDGEWPYPQRGHEFAAAIARGDHLATDAAPLTGGGE